MARNRKRNDYPVKKRKSPMRVIAGWILFIGVFLVLIFALVPLVGATMKVTDGAMGPSLGIGDTVAVNHISYLLLRPKRGDVVQFVVAEEEQGTPAQTSTVYLRRVIGLPGETVQIVNGKVYINGSETPLDDSFIKETMKGSYGPYVVPEDSYFMLGDNRNNSWDSRKWKNTFVNRDKILGKAGLRYWPLSNIGFLH